MKVPKHLGIIPDGNRRFAKRLMLEPWKGHEYGAEKFKKIAEWCEEYGISELTIWGLSMQNLNRPKKELDFLMELAKREFESLKNREELEKTNLKFDFIGNLHLLPDFVQKAAQELKEATKNNTGVKVNFALAYGGRDELVSAVKEISERIKTGELKTEDIDEDTIMNSLQMPDNVDYVIRTGGERRTSGFFIWQSDYAEYCFLDKMFPEFDKEDFVKAIEDFSERERRFGK